MYSVCVLKSIFMKDKENFSVKRVINLIKKVVFFVKYLKALPLPPPKSKFNIYYSFSL